MRANRRERIAPPYESALFLSPFRKLDKTSRAWRNVGRVDENAFFHTERRIICGRSVAEREGDDRRRCTGESGRAIRAVAPSETFSTFILFYKNIVHASATLLC